MKKATVGRIERLEYSTNEALNTICSNLTFAGRNLKKIVLTSCTAGEGKSFLTLQIAQNLAKRGKKICLVDADLRRSFLVKRYDITTEGEWVGLAHYLAGYNKLEDVIYRTNLYDICLIPIGRDVANPVPLLDSPDFSAMLDRLPEEFDLVLVDAPPVGLVIDAAEIASVCDGAIFVIEYNKTRRREIQDAHHQIEQTGCRVLGCIINKVRFDTISAKKYYNKSYYSHYNSEYYRKDSGSDGKRKKP